MFELKKFVKDDAGATAIEYGLIAALVAVAGVIGFTSAGNVVIASFTDIADGFCEAVGGTFTLTNTGEDSCTF